MSAGGGSAPRRLLIVLLGAIGDVVRGLPVAMRVRAGWPHCSVAWAVEPAAEPLVRDHPAVDRVIVFRRSGGAPAFVRFLREVRAFGAEVALDLQRHLKSGIVALASGAGVRIGFHRRNSREGNWMFQTHTIPPVDHFSSKVGQYQRFADVLGLAPAPVRFGLRAPQAARRRVEAWLPPAAQGVGAVLVGSTWPSRFWFPEAAAAVCRGFHERGLLAVLLGAAGERAFAQEIVRAGAPGAVDLVGRTGLDDVVAVLERSAVAVGPDSGPMHIAAAVGTPVVSLWGATSPRRSAPFGQERLVLRGDVPCAPCYQRRCRIGRLCMASIRPQAVLARVDEVLGVESEGADGG